MGFEIYFPITGHGARIGSGSMSIDVIGKMRFNPADLRELGLTPENVKGRHDLFAKENLLIIGPLSASAEQSQTPRRRRAAT